MTSSIVVPDQQSRRRRRHHHHQQQQKNSYFEWNKSPTSPPFPSPIPPTPTHTTTHSPPEPVHDSDVTMDPHHHNRKQPQPPQPQQSTPISFSTRIHNNNNNYNCNHQRWGDESTTSTLSGSIASSYHPRCHNSHKDNNMTNNKQHNRHPEMEKERRDPPEHTIQSTPLDEKGPLPRPTTTKTTTTTTRTRVGPLRVLKPSVCSRTTHQPQDPPSRIISHLDPPTVASRLRSRPTNHNHVVVVVGQVPPPSHPNSSPLPTSTLKPAAVIASTQSKTTTTTTTKMTPTHGMMRPPDPPSAGGRTMHRPPSSFRFGTIHTLPTNETATKAATTCATTPLQTPTTATATATKETPSTATAPAPAPAKGTPSTLAAIQQPPEHVEIIKKPTTQQNTFLWPSRHVPSSSGATATHRADNSTIESETPSSSIQTTTTPTVPRMITAVRPQRKETGAVRSSDDGDSWSSSSSDHITVTSSLMGGLGMSLAALAKDVSPLHIPTLGSPPLPPPPPRETHTQWLEQDTYHRCCHHLHKWGVPVPSDTYHSAITSSQANEENAEDIFRHKRQVLEQTLKQRLIWIRYRGRYLWPAILYDNYRQLIHDENLSTNVWFKLPLFWKRIQVATRLVWNPHHPQNNCRVARLLGRSRNSTDDSNNSNNNSGRDDDCCPLNGQYEMTELMNGETFWYFGDASIMNQAVNDMALNVEYFRNDPDLYLDWHRAMDQMERLLNQCLGLCSDRDDLSVRHDHHQRLKISATQRNVGDKATKLDDNSLVAAAILEGGHRVALDNKQEEWGKKTTWVQRAKEAEHERRVETYSDCSMIVLESLYNCCTWKDKVVAGCSPQQYPVRKDPGPNYNRRSTNGKRC